MDIKKSSNKININEDISYGVVYLLFMKEFAIFENLIRENLKKNRNLLDDKTIRKLYFFHGGDISFSADLKDFDDTCIFFQKKKFNEDETFNTLSINKILKIISRNGSLENFACFNFSIKSLNTTDEIDFSICSNRLIAMRNVLAHQTNEIEFKDSKHIIEHISEGKLQEITDIYFSKYNFLGTNQNCKYMITNFYFLKEINTKLEIQLLDNK